MRGRYCLVSYLVCKASKVCMTGSAVYSIVVTLAAWRCAVILLMLCIGMAYFTDSVICCVTVCEAVRSGVGCEYYCTASYDASDLHKVGLITHRVVTLYTGCV